MINNQPFLRVFVYGTLKRGCGNHRAHCGGAVSITPASVWGRIYHLSAGFPGLEIPEDRILASGSGDPAADLKIQESTPLPPGHGDPPRGDWDRVRGELMTFADPLVDLPPLDRLEGFVPGDPGSMYLRVLFPVQTPSGLLPAWLYRFNLPHHGTRLPAGIWPG